MTGKFFTIRSQLNDLVLDVSDCNACSGNPVVTWHYNGGPNQLFFEDPINRCIRSGIDDNYCLEIQGGSLVVNEFHPHNSDQKWMVSGDRICNADSPDQVFDIADHNTDPGARVTAWEYNGGPNQLWSVEYQPPRYCYIRSHLSGKVLDIGNNDSSPGAEVIMWDQADMSDNQLWYENMYGIIHSKLNDYVLDLSEGDARMMPYDPSSVTQAFVKYDDYIANKSEETAVLDIKDNNSDNGAKVITWEINGQDNQKWTFDYL